MGEPRCFYIGTCVERSAFCFALSPFSVWLSRIAATLAWLAIRPATLTCTICNPACIGVLLANLLVGPC